MILFYKSIVCILTQHPMTEKSQGVSIYQVNSDDTSDNSNMLLLEIDRQNTFLRLHTALNHSNTTEIPSGVVICGFSPALRAQVTLP